MLMKKRLTVVVTCLSLIVCLLVMIYLHRTVVPKPHMVKSYRRVVAVPTSNKSSRPNMAEPVTGEKKDGVLVVPTSNDGDRSNTNDPITVQARGGRSIGQMKLIVLSYMRAGSTFTADLFNQHPEVFYIYEPLWSFDFHFKKGLPLHFLDGRPPIRYDKNDSQQLDALQKDTIRSLLSCHLQRVGVSVFEVMKAPFSHPRTKRIQDFLRCYNTNANLQNCLPKIQNACDTARVTVVKALRFTMKQALTLLQNDPQVRVIHLVRDPRGVLKAREVAGFTRDYNFTAGEFCSAVLQDVIDSKTLRAQFPGRVLTVRFEDLTADPLNYTHHLLHFAGLDFSPQHRHYVWTATSNGTSKKAGTLKRANSKSSAMQWRLKINADFVRNADQHCSGLYEQMGYLRLSEKSTLRNLSRPYYDDCRNVVAPVLCLH